MADSPGAAFDRLVDIVARLRGPGGCPWDREQTLESLRPFVLEETYEVLETIDSGNRAALREEIGDLIFEGVLLAQLCAEAGEFDVADSLGSITEKLVRRHPHVFGDAAPATSADEVLGRWEEAKARERVASPDKGQPKTILGGVPKSLPALLRAHEMSTRAAAVGFEWERPADVLAKIEEEVAELREAVERSGGAGDAEERRRQIRGGDGRSAVRDRQPRAETRRGAGVGSADVGRQVRAALHGTRAPLRGPRRVAAAGRPRTDGRRVGAREGVRIRLAAGGWRLAARAVR